MPDDLHLDPFERRHVGEHGAFLVRTDPRHVELSVKAIMLRRQDEVEISFGPSPLCVVRKKAA